jgi:hypothetical protein
LTDDTEHRPGSRPRRGGITSRDGLTNGEDAQTGLEVGVGLINGLPKGQETRRSGGLSLLRRSRRKGRAAREALERMADAPLPGADGE